MCLFISLPVYRWVLAKVSKTKNKSGLPKGEWGIWKVGSEPNELDSALAKRRREERAGCVCRRSVDLSDSAGKALPSLIADIAYAGQDLTRL